MKSKLQLAATALLILLSTFCHASTTATIVNSINHNVDTTSINTSPVGYVPYCEMTIDEGNRCTQTQVISVHGELISCNNEEPSCYSPSIGETGDFMSGPHVYSDFPNVTIKWSNGVVATYAMHREY
jgi:hypothetical protein